SDSSLLLHYSKCICNINLHSLSCFSLSSLSFLLLCIVAFFCVLFHFASCHILSLLSCSRRKKMKCLAIIIVACCHSAKKNKVSCHPSLCDALVWEKV